MSEYNRSMRFDIDEYSIRIFQHGTMTIVNW